MEDWQEGEVVENIKWTKNLASLKIKAKINTHQAG
ncbi:MAG: ferredoxin--NADP(+) reductase, partial [Nitrosomonadales bacterium]|nr:ferredoxin--NADP(+) reductase [Nitrosomonadales bacterium]